MDVRLNLSDSVADLLHVLHHETPSVEDSLAVQARVFDQLWDEIQTAVVEGTKHFDIESNTEDSVVEQIQVVNDTERNASK